MKKLRSTYINDNNFSIPFDRLRFNGLITLRYYSIENGDSYRRNFCFVEIDWAADNCSLTPHQVRMITKFFLKFYWFQCWEKGKMSTDTDLMPFKFINNVLIYDQITQWMIEISNRQMNGVLKSKNKKTFIRSFKMSC